MSFTEDGQMQSTWHIRVGSTFRKSYKWSTGNPPQPVDLTGWTAESHIRAKESDSAYLIKFSTADNTIRLGADGSIDFELPYADTAPLAAVKKAVFDVELTQTSTGFRRNLIGGPVIPYGERTRS